MIDPAHQVLGKARDFANEVGGGGLDLKHYKKVVKLKKRTFGMELRVLIALE